MLLLRAPLPLFIEFGEVVEGLCYFGKVLDELAVKITETDEFPDCFDVSGQFPILYHFYFDTFHFKFIGG